MNRRRIMLIVAAVLLALIGIVIIVAYVRSAENRATEGTEVVTVLVATEEIDASTPASDLAGRVAPESVPARLKQDDAVENVARLGNQVTISPIRAGEQIVRRQFGGTDEVMQDGAAQIEQSMEVVSVSLEPQRAVDGRLSAGDRVSVIVSIDAADVPDENAPGQMRRRKNPTGVILSNVPVTAVTGGVTDESGEAANAVTVSLQVVGSDAERIVFAMEHGSVWLTLNGEDVPDPDAQMQTPDNIYEHSGGGG